jgi:glycosyltransferase involved in cell wall biosynthesis
MIDSKPRIIILNDFGHINGGAGKVALNSAAELARSGYEVTVFCAVRPIDPSLTDQPRLRVVCIGQQEIRSDPWRVRAACQGLWNRRAVKALSTLLEGCDRKNTIVHAHSWTKALSSAALHIALEREFKLVITLHDYFLACPNGGLFDYQMQQVCHRQPLSTACNLANCDSTSYAQKLWRIGRQYVQRDISRVPGRVRHFISISDLSEGILRPFLPANSRIYRVLNPIDVAHEPPTEVAQNRVFLFVGRIAPEKGVLPLVRAAQLAGVPITLVGDGLWRARVEACNPQARITGWLNAEGVRDQMRHARTLVFPSLWYETNGLVVQEAAALGVPCIVSDVTAAREMVVDGETGLWFRSSDEQDLAATLRLLEDPDMARRLGAGAHQKYWANPITMSDHIASLERCYEQMLLS